MPSEMIIDGVEADATSAEYQLDGYDVNQVEIWSAATSGCTVTLYARSDATGSPWYDLGAGTTNPSNLAPVIWAIPTVGKFKAVVSGYAGGKVYVSLDRQKHRGQ